MTVQPFRVHIPDEVLADLGERIARTRWPDEITGSGWKHGADLAYMKELAEYWRTQYDWRKTEAEINQYPSFIADVDGYKIHFIHVKGSGKNPIPLMLLHGWPGSFLELMKLIPLLTRNDEQTFDLVIPSLLGYGFSQKITEPGCDLPFMAPLFQKLMAGLGYDKYGVHGGDFGSGLGMLLALKYPRNIIGLHVNNIEGYYKPYLPEGESLTEEEIRSEREGDEWYDREGAYSHQQRTRPLTLAYALTDSPVGLCAWLVEKFHGWSDCAGNIENVYTKDELLAHVTLYWVTETIHSSMRLYGQKLHLGKGDRTDVPVGVVRFPLEDCFPPRSYVERGFRVHRWTEMPAGGHFPAMEQPELLAGDIRDFFGSLLGNKQ